MREKNADEKFCADCGEVIRLKAEICPKCGCRQTPVIDAKTSSFDMRNAVPKSRTVAAVLAIVLGGVGAHKFYLEKPLQGVIYLILCFTFLPAILGFVEGIRYLLMTDSEFAARLEQGTLENIGGVTPSLGPTPETHVKCPDCRELILKDARVCRFCGCKLIPQ